VRTKTVCKNWKDDWGREDEPKKRPMAAKGKRGKLRVQDVEPENIVKEGGRE